MLLLILSQLNVISLPFKFKQQSMISALCSVCLIKHFKTFKLFYNFDLIYFCFILMYSKFKFHYIIMDKKYGAVLIPSDLFEKLKKSKTNT